MSIIVKSETREEREKDFKDVKNYKKGWKRIKKRETKYHNKSIIKVINKFYILMCNKIYKKWKIIKICEYKSKITYVKMLTFSYSGAWEKR